MITGGISFQPGGEDSQRNRIDPTNNANGTQEGVQEAIKVLSLRLPKVVGSRAVAPGQLLNAPGSMGNPHADSIVEAVMQKFFPTNTTSQPEAPGAPMGMNAPQFDGVQAQTNRPPQPEPNFWNQTRTPQIIADQPQFQIPDWFGGAPPQKYQNLPGVDGGGGIMSGPPLPDLKKQLDWVSEPTPPQEQPLI